MGSFCLTFPTPFRRPWNGAVLKLLLYPFGDLVALICNEEGKLLGLPLNRPLRHPETGAVYDIVCGTCFLCGAPPGSDRFASLTEEQIARYSERFRAIELFPEVRHG